MRDGRWTTLLLHSIVVALAVAIWHYADEPSSALMLAGALCFPAYLALGFLEARRSPLFFTPLSFYFFWNSVALGASAFYMGRVVGADGQASFSVTRVGAEDVATGYAIYLLGSLALHAGLQALRPKASPERRQLLPSHAKIQVVLLLAAAAAGLALSFWSSPRSSSLGMVKAVLDWALLAAAAAFALNRRRLWRLSDGEFWAVMMAGTAALLFTTLGSGSKAFIMFSFLPVVWKLTVSKPLRKWLLAAGVACALVYFGVVVPVVGFSRMRPIDPDANQFRHMASAFQDWLSDAPAGLDAPTYSQQFEAFLRRQFDPLPVGFFVGIVRDFGFQYGATMDYAAYAFVPRIIWEDKPNVTRGAWFAHYLGFARSEEQSTTSIGMTAVGELYWNFGVPGVLGGMFVIGALLSGLLWRMTGADPSLDPIRLWLYVTLMLSMADMPEAVTVLVSIVAKFILFKAILLGFRFWSLPARREYAILPAR